MPGLFQGLRRRAAYLLAALVMIIAQSGCAGKSPAGTDRVARDSFYFDTICTIAVYDMEEMSEERALEAISTAFEKCAYYEDLLSRTKEGTDIWRLNHAGGAGVTVSEETASLIRESLSFCALSEGRFDITVGKITDLWDFHAEEPSVPSEEKVRAALETVDFRGIVFEEDGIFLQNPETAVDLGAVAKGYIADRLCEVLREEGVTSAVVSLGGNIACIGGKGQEEGPFTIGVETPFSDRSGILGTVPCKSGTVVTSGIYERCFEKDGVLYHHILDARTGYPCETDVIGVTVTAAEGRSMECDALATVCLLLGSEEGLALIEETEGVEALFVTENGITKTSGMEFTPEK